MGNRWESSVNSAGTAILHVTETVGVVRKGRDDSAHRVLFEKGGRGLR